MQWEGSKPGQRPQEGVSLWVRGQPGEVVETEAQAGRDI